MEIEREQSDPPSAKRTMNNVDEWLRKVLGAHLPLTAKSKVMKESTTSQKPIQMQESSYDASVMLHYNTDVVIGGFTGMFVSATERESARWKIAVNGSGSGVEDVWERGESDGKDTFVFVKANNPSESGMIYSGDALCIRHKCSIR